MCYSFGQHLKLYSKCSFLWRWWSLFVLFFLTSREFDAAIFMAAKPALTTSLKIHSSSQASTTSVTVQRMGWDESCKQWVQKQYVKMWIFAKPTLYVNKQNSQRQSNEECGLTGNFYQNCCCISGFSLLQQCFICYPAQNFFLYTLYIYHISLFYIGKARETEEERAFLERPDTAGRLDESNRQIWGHMLCLFLYAPPLATTKPLLSGLCEW